MEVLYYKDLEFKAFSNQFYQGLEHLKSGNFSAAGVNKMHHNGIYRAILDHNNQLLFKFGKYENKLKLLPHISAP